MTETTDRLESALQQCQAAAHRGYQIAKDNIVESFMAISKVSKSLSQCMETFEDGSVRTPGIVDQLKAQLTGVVNELEHLQQTTVQHLIERRLRLDRFSITLFGRTMAGKSTLMEILTRGDGRSIGLGAQRTTRDVRSYTWKGMEVTDVPGIAAFEGAEDEELAFKSARQADLVVFLITDDAPQPVEAECLTRVCKLGKPVLGICNVKVAVDEKEDLLLFLRNPKRPFDRNRINQLLGQFHAFSEQHIPGKRIPFVVTHLRSRFLADRAEFAEYREMLLQASQFNIVESRIIQEVIGRGTFLRIKSFVDGAVTPMMDLTDFLLDFSAQNSASGRVLIDKRRQLQEWSQSFKTDCQKRINAFVSKLMNDLRDGVSEFAEDHYEDSDAGKRWNDHIRSTGFNEKIEKLQNEMLEECKKALLEVARELKRELSLVAEFVGNRKITMNSIFDSKRAWNWGTHFLSGGLGVAALILGSGPLGWAAVAVGVLGWLFSFFFEPREEKARKAREKLSKSLYNDIDRMEHGLNRQLSKWFHQELLGKQVYVLLHDLQVVTSGLFDLADSQRNLAWTLNDRQKVLGRILVEEALRQLNAEDTKDVIRDVARVPGFATMFLIEPNTSFPVHIKAQLERLLGEIIWFVIDTGNWKSILSQAIGRGCERDKIRIEWNLKVAHIPIDEFGMETRLRVKLGQQLTSLHVMK